MLIGGILLAAGITLFRVNTASNSAEFAQPTDLTVVTKSGSNQFHGSAFWYLQRKDWNAMDPIAQYNPSLNANTAGASIGGPIYKDHAFFYFDYEGVRLNQNTLIATQTIPTAWAGGDFSGVLGLVLANPFTGQVISCDKITNINPIAAKILPLFFPTPTNSSTNIDSTGNNLLTTEAGKYSEDGYDGRIDYAFNANHRVFFRITQKTPTDTGTDPTGAIGALGTSSDSAYNPLMGTFSTSLDATNLVASYNWIIRPNLLNELRGGWTRANYSYAYPQAERVARSFRNWALRGCPARPRTAWAACPFSTSAISWAEPRTNSETRASKGMTSSS